jgi:crotonobetainyl-CoA:carnitine CoA-transferase CaiB-like acyl-CoA transferase
LAAAIQTQNPDAFEDALNCAFRAGLSPDLLELLNSALLMAWHRRHEDVALALQELKDPSSVEALFAAASAKHAYMDYDEFFALARKCTWALADIGTPEARDCLARLAQDSDVVIVAYAQKRLDQWEQELSRKGK